ncbi:acyl-CoA dehydrogenase family protein [Rhodococcus opacus]|uniref:acyl-CoA dehydrogenase family protein n=1 Tax=Rhodococcus opacus TaxID=37919 RepID=UPI000EAAAA66|nr:acyl-CoA dehydrogenase family protein [Rhodococcus opacus]QZS52781.1 acyl-CoA/acyl-ACP dehydrogenase [Rhodococcus opacus]RKM65220.1 acyl-CoA dehydrogenase [Rhodococcus opacus]
MILEHTESSEDRAFLRESIIAMVRKVNPPENLLERAETASAGGTDSELWSALSGDFAAPALAVPEALGGVGATFAEAAVVLEELGAALATVPYLSTFVATEVLLAAAGCDISDKWVPRLAAGEATATVIFDPVLTGDHAFAEQSAPFAVQQKPDGYTLSGTDEFVIDGATADLILIPVRDASGCTLFAVEGKHLRRDVMHTLDPTRPLAVITAENAPAEVVGTVGDAGQLMARARDLALLAIGCEQLGQSKTVLNMAVEYARERRQFGRPIGSFQAIKHKLAEVAVAVQSAESAVEHGIWAAAKGTADELSRAAAMVAMACAPAAVLAAGECIQVHGGIGFTWEHPAHLYYRRALSSAGLLGKPQHHAERLFELALS